MLITKATGEEAVFSKVKYIAALKRSGLTTRQAGEICNNVYQDLYPHISTEKIYQKTHLALKKQDRTLAAKYSLKRAIIALGPGGFYFERYMASVLSAYGYKTRYNQILNGKCTRHEVDIVAERDNKKYMIECKFHNQVGAKSDIKVALYVYARFLDLKETQKFDEAVLITNTQFTSEAVKYARCMGVRMIGWHYPVPQDQESLEYYVEAKNLYPVTVLLSLNNYLKHHFQEANIVLASDLLKFTAPALAKRFKVKENLARNLIKEAEDLS